MEEKIGFELENKFDLNTKIARVEFNKDIENSIYKINFTHNEKIFTLEIEIKEIDIENKKCLIDGKFTDSNFNSFIQCQNTIKQEKLFHYFIHDNHIYMIINLTKIGEMILSYNPNKTYAFFQDRIGFTYHLLDENHKD